MVDRVYPIPWFKYFRLQIIEEHADTFRKVAPHASELKKDLKLMQYTIIRAPQSLGSPTAEWDSPVWEQAETLEITHFPWPDSGHRPVTRARFVYDDGVLGVSFRVEDQ